MATPAQVKLDKVRQIRFDFEAITKLDEVCGINFFDTRSLGNLSPSKIRDYIWAGQLHTEKPLARDKVVKYLPVDPEKLAVYTSAIIEAVTKAFNLKETPADDAAADKSDESVG